MNQTTAKVFMSGNSQAVRLPKEFHIDAQEVYITKDSGKIIMTPKQKKFSAMSKKEMIEFLDYIHCPEFERPPRNPVKNKRKDIFK
jgi:antitoxin VapB